MSKIETKAPANTRKSSPKLSKVAKEALQSALDAAQIQMVPFAELTRTELNARKHKLCMNRIRGLANSIESVGIMQNLVVFLMADGKYGVAAGGRRLSALELLYSEQRITDDYLVQVKVISEEMALVASITENDQREEMHPSDQITAFSNLHKSGKSPEEIGALLGFSTPHVKKCLRLSDMAPALLEALQKDEINLDQLRALSVTEDHERQMYIWNRAFNEFMRQPQRLRAYATEGAISAKNNS